MSKYIKAIEAYRLGDGEMPKWLQKAIKEEVILWERRDMLDIDNLKICKKAIVGIRRAGENKVYDIDSYIVYDSFKNLIKVRDSYDFEQEGYQKVED